MEVWPRRYWWINQCTYLLSALLRTSFYYQCWSRNDFSQDWSLSYLLFSFRVKRERIHFYFAYENCPSFIKFKNASLKLNTWLNNFKEPLEVLDMLTWAVSFFQTSTFSRSQKKLVEFWAIRFIWPPVSGP